MSTKTYSTITRQEFLENYKAKIAQDDQFFVSYSSYGLYLPGGKVVVTLDDITEPTVVQDKDASIAILVPKNGDHAEAVRDLTGISGRLYTWELESKAPRSATEISPNLY